MTVITVVLTIQLLLSLFFKTDRSRAFCGIFAFSGFKDLTKEQLAKALLNIKLLGFYNESRGGQGAGIFINNQIIKCGERLKTFPALMENYIPEIPKENALILGHCRRMSKGIVSTENTHPFLINKDLVGVHNGTIENMDEIAKERGVNINGFYNDSRQLYTVIEEAGTDCLNHYKGGAALMWTRLSTPNELHVFHGAHKKYSVNGQVEEERPLFYMETEEGIYLSSMESSLWAIRSNDDQIPFIVGHNKVFTLINGKISDKVETIAREEACLTKNFYPNSGTHTSGSKDYTRFDEDGYGHREGSGRHIDISRVNSDSYTTSTESMVWRETLPHAIKHHLSYKKTPLDRIYFHKGRYYKDLGSLCHGEIFLSAKGYLEEGNDFAMTTAHYFFNGVMLKDYKAHEELMAAISKRTFIVSEYSNFAMLVSKYAKHPVTNLAAESVNIPRQDRFKWYLDVKPFKGSFTPQFSLGRHYKINNAGYLLEIEGKMKKDKVTLYENMESRTKDIQKLMGRTGGNDPEIPFRKNGTEDAEETKEIEFNDPYFDAEFITTDMMVKNIPDEHMNAILTYLRMSYEETNALDPDEKELEELVDTLFITVVSSFRTIREVLEDEEGMLEQIMSYGTAHYPSQDDIDDDKAESKDDLPFGSDDDEDEHLSAITVIEFTPEKPSQADSIQSVLDEIDEGIIRRRDLLARAESVQEKEDKLKNTSN